MGLFEAKGQLDRGMKDLLIRWSMARAQWKDNVAAEFESKHLVPLQAHLRNASTGMSLAAGLVSRVRAECSSERS